MHLWSWVDAHVGITVEMGGVWLGPLQMHSVPSIRCSPSDLTTIAHTPLTGM